MWPSDEFEFETFALYGPYNEIPKSVIRYTEGFLTGRLYGLPQTANHVSPKEIS